MSSPPPIPSSAPDVLRLLEWCYDNRAVEEYREIFTADYRFVYSVLDSAGQAYRDVPWIRDDELISTTKLFIGGDVNQPAASSIELDLDRNFNVTADTRPGKHPKWHKSIKTQVVLKIRTAEGSTDVTGFANFFLVRGDSALIPDDLPFAPDSLRWYIERWEDETVGSGGSLRWQSPPPALSVIRPARERAAIASQARRNGAAARRSEAEIATVEGDPLPRVATWGYIKDRYRD
ncbi:MAG TPA: hypothetical protein VEY91_07160 [Candidatus Limnocylindria bacterium]|nr:hypothetical protein [Candidatus Limnocylindria bacterium]